MTECSRLDKFVRELPLKEMDGTLLQRGIHILMREDNIEALEQNRPQPFRYVTVDAAMQMASYLHRKQTRANRGDLPRTHYIEHPLRNALRLLRYGIADQDIILATILHDTIEDNLPELLLLSGSFETPPTTTGREHAVAYLNQRFRYPVGDLVLAVTNPVGVSGRTRHQKRAEYAAHVIQAIQEPKPAIIKLSDFIDNAAGLYHNDHEENRLMVGHLAQKYWPLISHFQARMAENDIAEMLSARSIAVIQQQLVGARASLSELI